MLAGARALLDQVSFPLAAGDFLAVLGPTGAGKTTLLRALTGNHPADRGSVLYNGRDVYAAYAELRNRIGYVPQDDILHPQLTVRSALGYAARLRFPPDVSAADRRRRVDEVMAELGLTERANLQVAKLSGGQRKRTSVAIELLTKPSLLFLDEPTSGLDPGYEKSVMELLRSLADGGRTVITVTHSIQSLDLCDRILFLAPGGQTAYFGPSGSALQFFGLGQYAEVFQYLDRAEPEHGQGGLRLIDGLPAVRSRTTRSRAGPPDPCRPPGSGHGQLELGAPARVPRTALPGRHRGRPPQHAPALPPSADPRPVDAGGSRPRRPRPHEPEAALDGRERPRRARSSARPTSGRRTPSARSSKSVPSCKGNGRRASPPRPTCSPKPSSSVFSPSSRP